MKKGFIFFVLLVACGFLLSFINTSAGNELGLNAPMPMADEKMKDVSGKEVSLNTSKTSKGILVIFSCNRDRALTMLFTAVSCPPLA